MLSVCKAVLLKWSWVNQLDYPYDFLETEGLNRRGTCESTGTVRLIKKPTKMAIWEIGGGSRGKCLGCRPQGEMFSIWRYIHSLKWGFGVDVEGD
jgi:hypothetical protein